MVVGVVEALGGALVASVILRPQEQRSSENALYVMVSNFKEFKIQNDLICFSYYNFLLDRCTAPLVTHVSFIHSFFISVRYLPKRQ